MTAALPPEAAGRPVEIWFTDEARVGQQGTLTRVWAIFALTGQEACHRPGSCHVIRSAQGVDMLRKSCSASRFRSRTIRSALAALSSEDWRQNRLWPALSVASVTALAGFRR